MPDVKFSNQYPYTDFHELNLDWVIKEVKFWSERVGKSIQTITKTGTAGLVDTYTITYSDNSTSTFDVTNGNGIASVAKTGTAGLVDTYTITFQDGSTSTFDVTNGTAAVDPTLTLQNYAADAKATGDAIGDHVYSKLIQVASVNGVRAYTTSTRVALTSNAGQICKIYEVKQGDKYLIRSYGYDASSFDVACIGDDLTTSTGVSVGKVEQILCGGSTYPDDYTNHVIEFTATGDGYLYINERTSTGVDAVAAIYRIGVPQNKVAIVDNGIYTYLYNLGGCRYINRTFNQRGPNNLLQLVSVGVGFYVVDYGYVENENFITAGTDIIGPVSLKIQGTPGVGQWCGGNHSVTVGGNTYPTAESDSIKAYINGNEISQDGIYFGDLTIKAVNKLYAPQTVTSADLSTATQVIEETRNYYLSDTLKVAVILKTVDNIYVSVYHGMQYVNGRATELYVPDDDAKISLPADYAFVNKQSVVVLNAGDNRSVYMIHDSCGLGNYAYNDGTGAGVGFGSTANYGKTYHTLIYNQNISTGKYLYWSGEYRQTV